METRMKVNLFSIIAILAFAGFAFGQGSGAIPPNWYADNGTRVLTYRASSAGNGTTTLAFNELIGKEFNYEGYFAVVLYDAAGDEALPQGEFREITDFAATTGVITVTTAFTVAVAAGDKVALVPSMELQTLIGSFGVPAVTAAEFTAGVSFAEGLLDINNDVDSLRSEVSSTTGIATFPTGVFHANGVSIAENAAWQSDTLRKVGVSTDSTLHYIHSTTGMPAVTGAFPAAGVSLSEKVQFIADTLRKDAVNTDSILFYLHSTTGMPAATGAFPAAGLSLNERIQFIADSLRKVAVSTDSTLFYLHSTTGAPAVTGAFPAAGLSLMERIQFIADTVRKDAVNGDSILFYLHSTTGAPAVTGAFPAAGLSINERIQYLADTLRKVGVTTDTVYSYLLTNTGAQWGTATEPANGVNLFEGVGFLQNQADSIAAALYTTTGAQWGTATEPANGVNLFEGVGFLQNQADSVVGALYGDVGLQWGTAAVPANGVAIDEVIRKISDAVAGANDFNRWEEPVPVVINFDAAGAWEEAATTHEVFTFTGGGDFEITGYCSTDVAVTSADSIFFISEGGGSIYRALGSDMDAGEGLFWGMQGTTGTPIIPTATVLDGDVGGVIRGHIEMGRDWGFDIDDNDFTAGIIVLKCRFRPDRAGSTVVAGAGAGL